MRGLLPRPVRATPSGGTLSLDRPPEPVVATDPSLPAEGFLLTIDESGVRVAARDPAGEFHAGQTLRQLLGPDAFRAADLHSGRWTLPCGEIEDHPRFRWRGCLLDVARHFMPKAGVLRFVDLLAAHRLNVLHLHLTDDQGWRIEIPEFPRLTSVGGWRHESMIGRHDGPERDGRPHGGFYTVDDLREIVAYARERHVTVVPEVDVPGHSQAAIAAYPELGNGEQVEVWTSWGINPRLLDPTESTVDFYRTVFDTVLEIFPSKVIAIGGDEVPGATEHHARLVHRMIEHLNGRGRRALGWDEILDGAPATSAIIGSWRGEEAGVAAAAAGHDVVMCPEQHVYLDHRQSDHPDEPIPVGYLRTLADVYAYEPIPAALPESSHHKVLGAQAQVWTEHLDSARRVDYAAFPRLAAFAETVWSPADHRDYDEFERRLTEHHLPRLDALGVEYRPLTGPHPWQTRPGVPGRPR